LVNGGDQAAWGIRIDLGQRRDLDLQWRGTILTVSKNSLVNNSYAAPATNGWGGVFEFLSGPIVNSSLGVSASAGHNTAILNGTLKQTGSEAFGNTNS
jgi:hypothetical protein